MLRRLLTLFKFREDILKIEYLANNIMSGDPGTIACSVSRELSDNSIIEGNIVSAVSVMLIKYGKALRRVKVFISYKQLDIAVKLLDF